ncbi:DUF6776 family protein [Ideonella livida]|uniref:Uncharacterized protein n=1 Tax=Ideonella livida TaxID=2707176 RepID=A0A7C9PI79_9BURK|nr:DUF6776 family protein [Ideonella livida]NDY92633.1 hypothetical protein [Ideonella livida]
MRWKLFRRRLSISAPRMIVRSHLPWPLRWAALAVMLGFSGALALWAFEFGKDIAGVDRGSREEVVRLHEELSRLRDDRDRAQSIANTAESLLKTERASQEKLAEQLRQVEADNLALKADLGFFERLLPAAGKPGGLQLRGVQVQADGAGLRYQVLVTQAAKAAPFAGRLELQLSGTQQGRPWSLTPAEAARTLQVKSYARLEGHVSLPAQTVVKLVQIAVRDGAGAVVATESVRL